MGVGAQVQEGGGGKQSAMREMTQRTVCIEHMEVLGSIFSTARSSEHFWEDQDKKDPEPSASWYCLCAGALSIGL